MKLETIISRRLFTGARRIAAGIAAAMTLLLAGGLPAWAATATLTGATTNSCTISTGTSPVLAVSGSGDITIQCSTAGSPGLLSLTQASYTWVPTQTFPGAVQRSGGSTGAVSVDWTVTNCATTGASTGTINFAAGDSANKPIPFTTTATTGLCNITLSNFTAGTQGSPISAPVTIVDPNANVTFKFTSPGSPASFGGSPVNFNISREGGSNGEWNVPIELAGTMAGMAGSGTLTASPGPLNTSVYPFVLTFGPNVMSQTLTYTPPAVPPTGVTPPGTMILGMQQPVAGPGGVPSGQTASIPAAPTGQPTHTITVSVLTTCPTPGSNVTTLNAPTIASPTAQRYAVSGPAGQIISIPAPATTFRVRTFDTVTTPASGFGTSFGLVRCPADTPSGGQTGPVPCKKQGGWSGNTLDIASTSVLFPPNCYWTPAERQNQWYFNTRIDYCPAGMSCQFFIQIEY